MDARKWWIVLLLVVACAWSAPTTLADEEEPPPFGEEPEGEGGDDMADIMAGVFKRVDAMVKGLSKFVGETRLTEKGVTSLLEHAASFHAVGKAAEESADAIDDLLEESYRTKGVYDFGLILGVKELQAWAKERKLDAGAWTRSMMRAQGLLMRAELIENAAKMKREAAKQLEQLESVRKQMGEDTYQAARKALEAGVKMAEETAKSATDGIPAATEAEAKLLAKHGKALKAALEGPDDEDDDEDGMDDGD